MKIEFATTEAQLVKCRAAILELRPHISEGEYLEKTKLLLDEGAKIIYVEEDMNAVAVMVFRVNYYLARGKNIYIDDLSTLPGQRGKGYAGALLDFAFNFARENNCDSIHLDSGYGLNRRTAHRLYLNKGFVLASHHFVRLIE